ncbi:unnamed protein product [Spirodela intermedia]|uniref:Uncharacterized protein n=1 Tax=Spirodela intermedia TaxID=51605 RepID=A0A7I8KK87_SPIIN|nr:unnamed protein product [Spirodela intermedia]
MRDLREIRDPLVVGGVVGDVLDPFTRCISLRVFYTPNHPVVSGAGLRPSGVSSRPRACVGGELRTFFTLVLVDPDSPSPSNRMKREYLHWLVTDIPGSTAASFGQEAVSYEAPQPTAGIHRLVFVLFRQTDRQTVRAPADREYFSTRVFAQHNSLGPPVGAVYFNCQRENGAGGRRFM